MSNEPLLLLRTPFAPKNRFEPFSSGAKFIVLWLTWENKNLICERENCDLIFILNATVGIKGSRQKSEPGNFHPIFLHWNIFLYCFLHYFLHYFFTLLFFEYFFKYFEYFCTQLRAQGLQLRAREITTWWNPFLLMWVLFHASWGLGAV